MYKDYAGYLNNNPLSETDIPTEALIVGLADRYDALRSRRPYKEPMSYDATMEILEQGRSNHFDPELLDAFAIIAADLHAEYGGHDDDRARNRLEELSHEYFRRDIADLMK